MPKRRRLNKGAIGLTALVVATAGAVSFAVVDGKVAGKPEPVSPQVQQYYDEHVASAKPTLPTAAKSRVVAFIGDSYTSGAQASPGQRWTTKLAASMGWTEQNLGRGGTGYLATAGKDGCGLDYCPNYQEMIPEAAKLNPDIVVVSGGRNDWHAGIAASGPAVTAFYSQLKTALPKATIVVVNPIWDATDMPAVVGQEAGVVKAQAEAAGAHYLDIGQPLAGKPALISKDGVHPNDQGYTAIFTATSTALQAAKIESLG